MEQNEKPIWQNYMPDYINLYYVDRDSDLDNHYDWLQQCVKENCLCSLDEKVLDLWDYPEGYYLDEIEKKMDADDLYDEFVAHEDEIKDWIWEHDESTPVEDMLGNTAVPTFFYFLGLNSITGGTLTLWFVRGVISLVLSLHIVSDRLWVSKKVLLKRKKLWSCVRSPIMAVS